MEDCQHGAMSVADDNIEKLTGKKPMSVGYFARAHPDQLNPQKSNAAKIESTPIWNQF
jgi:NAD(P)H dehydrogenase (quinone)